MACATAVVPPTPRAVAVTVYCDPLTRTMLETVMSSLGVLMPSNPGPAIRAVNGKTSVLFQLTPGTISPLGFVIVKVRSPAPMAASSVIAPAYPGTNRPPAMSIFWAQSSHWSEM